MADAIRVRTSLEEYPHQLRISRRCSLVQGSIASSLLHIDVSTLGNQEARRLAILAQRNARMQWLIVHGVAREAVHMCSVSQQQYHCLRSAKPSRQVQRRPAVSRVLMNQHGILLQQRFDAVTVSQGGGLEYIESGQMGEQEIPDQRLAAINAPQKGRDALGVSACNHCWIFFRGGGHLCRLSIAYQIKETLTHRFRVASVSATEAAKTVSLDPFCTEPGLVRLE